MLKDSELIRINISKPFFGNLKHNEQIQSQWYYKYINVAILRRNQCFNFPLILQDDNKLIFKNEDFDPSKLQKDNRFPADLRVEIQFKDFFQCTNEIQFNQRCKVVLNCPNNFALIWNQCRISQSIILSTMLKSLKSCYLDIQHLTTSIKLNIKHVKHF